MIEILAYIALVYCIVAVISFCVLTFINGFNSSSFAGIGIVISIGLAAVWPIMVPMYIIETIKDRKNK